MLSLGLVLGAPVLVAWTDPPAAADATEKSDSGGVKETIKKDFKDAGRGVGKAATAVGHAVRKGYRSAKKGVVTAGKAIGRGGRKVGQGVKAGAKEVKEGVKDAVHGEGEGGGDQAAQ